VTSWSTPPFRIGGIPIELPQAVNLSMDTPAPSGGFTDLRMGSGAPRRIARWARIKSTISFDGYLPAGLSDLDWTIPQTVQYPMPRSAYSTTNEKELPANRRTDCPPEAVAWVGGFPRPTPVTMNVNMAVASPFSNATGYTFSWWPEFSALVTISESGDRTKGTFQYHIEIEEV
jgi:hypothetical protein